MQHRKFRQRRQTAALATAVAIALLAAGCAEDSSSGDQGVGAIAIGQVGNYSGPVPGLAGQGVGFEAWVKTVNDAGGISGRKIELYKEDAKGDPAAEVSKVAQLITKNKVVAFGGMGLMTISGSAPMLVKQGIPVVGGNTSDIAWGLNENFYVPGSGMVGSYLLGYARVPAGKEKVGVVYCKESAACSTVKTLMIDTGLSKANGGDPVYNAEASLAAPSFTSQCLAAKQAGVQTLAVAFDAENLIRFAKGCKKRDPQPIYTIGTTAATAEVAASGVVEGSVSVQLQAPSFRTDGEVGNHRAAMQKYFPDEAVDGTTVAGWAAGLAMQKGIENALAADPQSKLTSEDIRAGLAKIKDETFNGLTPPVSFSESGIQKQSLCGFSVVVKDGKWTEEQTEPVCPSAEMNPVAKEAEAKLAELAGPAG